ncbi:MAG: histidine kinase [Chloroflexota bacterium]|nr:histidine kinase [Chloroflexota bacterium]
MQRWWGSLRFRIIAWTFIPTALSLLMVALVTFYAYRQATGQLVIERDRELVRLSAGQLSTEIAKYSDILVSLARTADIYGGDPSTQQVALMKAHNRLVVFDGGALVLNTFGRVVATHPDRPELLGQDLSTRSYFRQLVQTRRPLFSNIVADGPDGTEVIVAAVPILGERGEFMGMLAGMFRLGAPTTSAFYGGIVKQRIAESGTLYVVDGNGRVIYHPDPEQVGADFSAQRAVQVVRDGRVDAILSSDVDGRDTVAGLAPVPMTPWGLVTEESLATLMRGSERYQQFLIALLLLGGTVPALITAVGVRQITRPVEELTHAAQEVAQGHFDHDISTQMGGEIGELAKQFNLMAAQLQASYGQLEQRVADRTKELATLYAVAVVVSRSLNLEEVLDGALEKVMAAFDFEAGAIYLREQRTRELQLACQRGDVLPFGDSMIQTFVTSRVIESKSPLIVNDLRELLDTPSRLIEEGHYTLASIPLLAKDEIEGVLAITCRSSHYTFSQQDIDLCLSIGNQIGIAVENARLYQQAQQLAVVEERQRLARELHDSVTQSLYSLTLFAEAGRRQSTVGAWATVEQYLGRLSETAHQALKEMRLLVYELRPPTLEHDGLVGALQRRLDAVEKRAGIDARLLVEGDRQLPAPLEEALYRIAQEAFNNALKHASASTITVRLYADEREVMLEVVDDGQGFDVSSAVDGGGLGLTSMRERVERLGGFLTILSQPGVGTTVRVQVSMAQQRVEASPISVGIPV